MEEVTPIFGNLTYLLLMVGVVALALIGLVFFFFKKRRNNEQIDDGEFSQSISSKGDYNTTNDRRTHHRRKLSLNAQAFFDQTEVFNLIPESIIVLDLTNRISYLNATAEQMLDSKLRSVMGKPYTEIFDLLHPKTHRPLRKLYDDTKLSQGKIDVRQGVVKNLSKKTYDVVIHASSVELSGEDSTVLVLKNQTEQKALESQLYNLERFDNITRFLNRKTFELELKQVIENVHKNATTHVLCYITIDQFEVINDAAGYAAGDSLISQIGNIISNNTQANVDVVSRVGGDDFAIVFLDKTLPQSIETIKNILHQAEELEFKLRSQPYEVTLSSGFVILNHQSTSATRALSESNIACNLAFKHGGNRIQAYREDDDEVKRQQGNLEWVMILKQALSNDQFEMYAQPIHSLDAVKFKEPYSHYELLIRMQDEEGNQIPPGEFLSAAEYYSIMPKIDRWVVNHVLDKLSAISNQKPMPVFAINLSGQSLNDASFLAFVLDAIEKSDVDPQMLCFEITEQVAVDDLNLVTEFIASLKRLGASLSLDDFGTGVSSYGYLQSLDVDYLKIDGSFVKDIEKDEVAKAMVQSIKQVGHTMDLKIIAEFVENDEIIRILSEMGIDYGQGYGIQRPGPFDEVVAHHLIVESDQGQEKKAEAVSMAI